MKTKEEQESVKEKDKINIPSVARVGEKERERETTRQEEDEEDVKKKNQRSDARSDRIGVVSYGPAPTRLRRLGNWPTRSVGRRLGRPSSRARQPQFTPSAAGYPNPSRKKKLSSKLMEPKHY